MNITEIGNALFSDVRAMIEESRQRVAASFDVEITLLYWNVSRRLKNYVLANARAEYGERI